MHKLSSIIVLVFLLVLSCDDGDIITVDLDFEDAEVQTCGNLVFYKENTSPPETLSIQLDAELNEEDLLGLDDGFEDTRVFAFNGTTNRLTYRTYTELPDEPFCSDIPPSQLNITSDDDSPSGSAILNIALVQDDNDGIPAALEDIDGDGDLDDDDTDGDGLPNYIDDDDDGDNVPTEDENPNYSAEDGLSLAQDSDSDGIPDYLDVDDDEDGVLTRDEENSNTQDSDPQNDFTFSGTEADYLNPMANDRLEAIGLREHTYTQVYTIEIVLINFELANLIQDTLNFGEYNTDPISKTVTPELD